MEGRELPVGWVAEGLASVVSLKTGPFGSSLHKSDYVNGATPVVNPMHIINGRIVPDAKTTVGTDILDRLKEFRLEVGDVVLGRRGEMGRAAVARMQEAGWLCGTGSLVLRQLGSLDPEFLQRFLSSPLVVMALEGASVGSTMVNLIRASFGPLRYLFPLSTNNAASPPSSTPPSPLLMLAASVLMAWRRSSSAFARRYWQRRRRGS